MEDKAEIEAAIAERTLDAKMVENQIRAHGMDDQLEFAREKNRIELEFLRKKLAAQVAAAKAQATAPATNRKSGASS